MDLIFAKPYVFPAIIPHQDLLKAIYLPPSSFAHLEYTALPWEVSCWWGKYIIKNALVQER